MRVDHGAKLFKACFNLVKAGGVMLLSTPCYDGKRHAANHIHEYTVPELQKAIEKAGFVVEQRYGTFMDIKNIGKVDPLLPAVAQSDRDGLSKAIKVVHSHLRHYYDNNALSNIFGPLYPDHARNNLWVCRKVGK